MVPKANYVPHGHMPVSVIASENETHGGSAIVFPLLFSNRRLTVHLGARAPGTSTRRPLIGRGRVSLTAG